MTIYINKSGGDSSDVSAMVAVKDLRVYRGTRWQYIHQVWQNNFGLRSN